MSVSALQRGHEAERAGHLLSPTASKAERLVLNVQFDPRAHKQATRDLAVRQGPRVQASVLTSF